MAVQPYNINRVIGYWMTEQMNTGAAQRSQIFWAGNHYRQNPIEFFNEHLDEVIADYVFNYHKYGADSDQAQQYLTDIKGAIGEMQNAGVSTSTINDIVNTGSQMGNDYYATWQGSLNDGGFGLGSIIGTLGDTFKDLGPLGVVLGNLAVPGLGTALGVITAIDEGADIGDIAKNVAIGEIVNQTGIGGSVADTVGSSLAGELAQNTVKGLLSGQDLDTALTNAAVNTGVSTVAGELTNQTPEDFQTDVETVLDSTAGVPVSELQADINQVLDMPISTPPAEQIMVTETPPDLTPAPTLDEIVAELEAGSLGSLSDLPEPIPESTPELVSGMDLAADATPGNTLADVELEAPATLTKAQVEEMIKLGLAATAATAAADQLTSQSESPGFDIVPVPTDWKSPVYDQSYVPIDLNTIFNNERVNWKPRPSIMGGAYMGSPVSINDIVNQIIGAELMPQAMPTNITNAVGGILGSTTTR